MLINDGDNDSGGSETDFSLDDDFFNLDFGDSEPADLNEADMSAGTEAAPVEQDLSGAPPPTAPLSAPDPQAAPAPAPAAPTPPAAPAATATPAPEATPATAPAQPSATEPQPSVNIEEFVSQNADAIIGNLAASHFKIDDKTAEALGFDPGVREFIEKRDAKNFLLTMVQMNNALQRTLPQVVANLMDVTQRVKETHTEFFSEFKDLADEKYVPHLRQLATTLRTLNPTLDKPSFIKLLGNTARTVFGLSAPQAQPQNAPARPGVRRGPARPFQPAGSVAPQRTPQNAPGGNGLEFLNNSLRLGADD